MPETLQELATIPIWFDYDDEGMLYYGFPPQGQAGFKIAYDNRTAQMDVETDDREYSVEIEERGKKYLDNRFPGFKKAELIDHKICHYDNSLDGHFIIDTHPKNNNLFLMTGSSGHGFKLAPALGRLMGEVVNKKSEIPIQFKMERFKKVNTFGSQFKRNA